MTAQYAFRCLLTWPAAMLLTGVIVAPVVSAQSLADVARRAEAQRRAAATGKAYTNANLPAVPPAPAARPAQAAAGAQAAAPQAPPADAPADTPAAPAPSAAAAQPPAPAAQRDEKYWRQRVAAEREALQRAESFAEALQSRINALSTDFVNRDDPAQRNVIAGDRQKALDELDRVQREITAHKNAIEATEQEARRDGVPPGWLR